MKRPTRRFFIQAPAFVWAFFILALLTIPGSSVPLISFWTFGIPFDSFVHGVLFCIEASLLWLSVLPRYSFRKVPLHSLVLIVLITTAFGGSTEILQSFIPERTGDMLDLLADAGGAMCFFCLAVSGLLDRIRIRLFA